MCVCDSLTLPVMDQKQTKVLVLCWVRVHAEPKCIPPLMLGQETKCMQCALPTKMEHFILVSITFK